MQNESVQFSLKQIPVAIYPSKDVSQKDSECDLHLHKETEIIKVLNGEKLVFANDKKYVLNQGDICIIKGNVPHHTVTPKGYSGILIQMFFNSEDMINNNIFDNRIIVLNRHNQTNILISECLENINDEYKKKKPYYDEYINADIIKMKAILQRENILKCEKDMIISNQKYAPVFEYTSNHYNEKISLVSVAKILGFEKSHFCRVFKSNFGMTYYDYLINFRIKKSIDLLTTTEKSIEEISYEVGFNSSPYFIKKFKEITCITPSKYRMAYLKSEVSLASI